MTVTARPLAGYAEGEIARAEMIETVASWPVEKSGFDPANTPPTHQDNTPDVLATALLNSRIAEADQQEINRRRQQP
ncbi:hypothetical protein [Streptomyces sp. Isolate_45]|uniref:hypothetical protein n=1 Tax=Streptomyces sp. Isolate_45 TaxID=2950111 RepID=UPI0024820CA1|nr:hypothetical protein [Streptomyces sp. Isolate_45]MDA5280011.1 hypothetical protein [Streptomyces sp. Isolate_45]